MMKINKLLLLMILFLGCSERTKDKKLVYNGNNSYTLNIEGKELIFYIDSDLDSIKYKAADSNNVEKLEFKDYRLVGKHSVDSIGRKIGKEYEYFFDGSMKAEKSWYLDTLEAQLKTYYPVYSDIETITLYNQYGEAYYRVKLDRRGKIISEEGNKYNFSFPGCDYPTNPARQP